VDWVDSNPDWLKSAVIDAWLAQCFKDPANVQKRPMNGGDMGCLKVPG
jgi:hypothetical protein